MTVFIPPTTGGGLTFTDLSGAPPTIVNVNVLSGAALLAQTVNPAVLAGALYCELECIYTYTPAAPVSASGGNVYAVTPGGQVFMPAGFTGPSPVFDGLIFLDLTVAPLPINYGIDNTGGAGDVNFQMLIWGYFS